MFKLKTFGHRIQAISADSWKDFVSFGVYWQRANEYSSFPYEVGVFFWTWNVSIFVGRETIEDE